MLKLVIKQYIMFTAPSILLRHKNSLVLSEIVIYYSMEIVFQKFNSLPANKDPKSS